jgi:hypothetical protein
MRGSGEAAQPMARCLEEGDGVAIGVEDAELPRTPRLLAQLTIGMDYLHRLYPRPGLWLTERRTIV